LIDESTSMVSIFKCPHPHALEWKHYRTGFQNEILAPVSESETFCKMIQRRDDGACKQPVASFLWLGGVAIMAGMPPPLKQMKLH
jgi:hypothetical protein